MSNGMEAESRPSGSQYLRCRGSECVYWGLEVHRGMKMGKRKRIAGGMSWGACNGIVRWVAVGVVVRRTPQILWQVV